MARDIAMFFLIVNFFFAPARKDVFRGDRTLETGSIDSTLRVDAIKKSLVQSDLWSWS